MSILRPKWVHVMLSEQERTAWQGQAAVAGLTLADLIRKRLGDAQEVGRDPIKRQAARRADPALLAVLGRIGSNLNQIARWANTYKEKAEAVQVLAVLVSIEQIISFHHPGAKAVEAGEEGEGDAG
jgi:hypothetical protein